MSDRFVLLGRLWYDTQTGRLLRVIQGGGPAVTVQNDKYAFGDDDNNEATHTLDSENTNRAAQSADVTFMIRIQIEETNGGNESQGYALFAQKNGAGGFTEVTTARADGIKIANDTQGRADDENTTERLSYGGASGFASGKYDDGQTQQGTTNFSLDQDTNGYTDLEFAIQIDSAVAIDSDYWELRVHFSSGTALDGYPGSYPTVTASIAAAPVTINCSAGSLSLAGQTADIKAPVSIPTNLGAVNLSGQIADIKAPTGVDANLGTLSLAGQLADIDAPVHIAGNLGSIILSGQTAGIYAPITIPANLGTLSLSGQLATIGALTVVDCSLGALTLSGQTAGIDAPVNIACSVGALSLAGQLATISLTGGLVTIDCQTGLLVLSGQTANIDAPVNIACAAGSMIFSGQTADIRSNTGVGVNLGALTLSGQIADIDAPVTIACSLGTLTFSGQNADILVAIIISVSLGFLDLHGQTATISLSGGAGFVEDIFRGTDKGLFIRMS